MHTPKFVENPFQFIQVIIRKQKYGRTYDRQTDEKTDEHMDNQRDTIIPRYYRVAGYKNVGKSTECVQSI